MYGQQQEAVEQQKCSHHAGCGRRRGLGQAPCPWQGDITPNPSVSLLFFIWFCLSPPPPPTPPRLMIQQAEEAKVFFLAVFSLPMLLPTSSRNKEGPRRGGGGRRNERLVVLCKGRDEEINNSHYSQEGVKGKQSQSGQAVFSWLQQTLPGVIYWATSPPSFLYLKHTVHSQAALCLPSQTCL